MCVCVCLTKCVCVCMCVLQFRIFFFFLQLVCVFSPVQAKSKTEQCQCAFKYHSRAQKRERVIIMCVFGLVFGICQRMCRRGVGVSCVLVCRRPWMLSRLQLGTATVHAPCRKQQEQATCRLNGHTLKTSTIPLASSSMSSRAMKQAINTCIILGCRSEQEVQGIFRFI